MLGYGAISNSSLKINIVKAPSPNLQTAVLYSENGALRHCQKVGKMQHSKAVTHPTNAVFLMLKLDFSPPLHTQ